MLYSCAAVSRGHCLAALAQAAICTCHNLLACSTALTSAHMRYDASSTSAIVPSRCTGSTGMGICPALKLQRTSGAGMVALVHAVRYDWVSTSSSLKA